MEPRVNTNHTNPINLNPNPVNCISLTPQNKLFGSRATEMKDWTGRSRKIRKSQQVDDVSNRLIILM